MSECMRMLMFFVLLLRSLALRPEDASERTDTSSTSQTQNTDWITRYMPIILSTLAGLSTCLGAAVVFCVDRPRNGKQLSRRRFGHKEMCFSLSLAGSVMITVSIFSILPESLTDDTDHQKFVSIGSTDFMQRTMFFASGSLLFFILSKCAFPEPNTVLGFEESSYSTNKNFESEIVDSSILRDTSLHEKAILRQNSKTSTNTSNSQGILKSSTLTHARKRSGTSQQNDDDDNVDTMVKQFDVDIESGETNTLIVDKIIFADKVQNGFCRISCPIYAFSGLDLQNGDARRAWRVTMLLFVSLAVHNFPEGLAVGASTIYNERLGWTTTVAIALHNIPEGIAIAVPCLTARPDSPCLAFGLASVSGLAEPLGAAVSMLVLQKAKSGATNADSPLLNMKNVLSFVAGIMITVAVLDLFPESLRHSKPSERLPLLLGTSTGAIVMLASEAYLGS